ncbi:MAG TPA: translocation/assembly module TamB domain-containing protein [Acidobacteriaceae bacterium]|nr:translocation/assembly module TamB domain-containing protein [Acidobacteriaceae bacterium]
MSADPKQPKGDVMLPVKRRRSLVWHVTRAGSWSIGGVLALVILLVGGITWYTTTAYFQRRVEREIVSVLENSTGGRVEVRGVQFSLWHLMVEVDGLVIHGTEGPGEAPYFSTEKIEVRVGISSFFSHATGAGLRSHVGLKLLRMERPQLHLIVDKDGKTNAPVPKHPASSKEPAADTLLDLRAKEVTVVDGVALVNDHAIPFNLTARDLDAEVHYLRATDRYGLAVGLNDLRTKMDAQPEAQSKLHFDAELGRDAAQLKELEFDSGAASILHASGTLTHFAQPEWRGAVNGTLELKQLTVLADVEGFTGGSTDLSLSGHSCVAMAARTQVKPRSWLGKRTGANTKTGAVAQAAVDPECKSGYLLVGNAKLHKAGFRNEYVILHDVDGTARVHITPSELLLTEMNGFLPGGGNATGELRMADWLGDAAHATLTSTVTRIPLRTIMEVTETGGYGDLGFDTAVTGPVKVEWVQRPVNVAETMTVDGQINFQPTGVARKGALNNVPVTGTADAHYDGKHEVVNIWHTSFQTPQSTTEAAGVLGVEDGDPLTNLKVDMTIRDLGEFDQLLHTLGFEENGQKGTAAIPIVLHGGMVFHGTAMGRADDLDVKGHVQGSQIEVKLGDDSGTGLGIGQDTVVDSVVGDAEFSYDEGLAIANSTIKRGDAMLNIAGSLRPRKTLTRRGAADYLWDGGTSVDATLRLANTEVVDTLQMIGEQQKIALTGKVAANAQVRGTLDNMNGQGKISLTRGVAYGEPYDSAVADLTVRGQEIDASQVVLMMHGARISGDGGYDLQTKHVHGHIEGDGLVMSKFQTFAKASPNADGTLTLAAEANGTIKQPGLKATAKLSGVVLDGKPLGEIAAEAHSESSELFYTVQSTLLGAKIDGSGQTELTGKYETQDRFAFSAFDVGTALELFMPGRVKAQSSIDGVVTVSGPLKTPTGLSGTAELSNFDVRLQGVELKDAEPMRVSLKGGVATLEQMHIVGQDTDLQASGTVQAFGVTDSAGGKLDVKASGSVSVAIVHTFDPDILSSGKVEFTVAAGGRVDKPSLTGRVKFDAVNAAVDGIPNGLSSLNGTLVFNEDRLEVENLTAMTGGGQLKIGGFLTYRNGIYADLTAAGDVVRVRLAGLSATGNTSLRLQGEPDNLLLSGTVLVTRFGVGPEVDFAAFAAAGGVSSPPDPNAASNKIQLNVHVTSSPQLDFQNSYAKLAGTADLTVRGTLATPTILGRIQITDGSATFAGTKYELQRGDIYFSNPVRIDPTIDLNATARVETYDITVGLQGTMSNLKANYRSDPPLSEADIFALLALGRTQEEAQLYQEQQLEAGTNSTSSALLGGALNQTVGNRIGKLFGGGSVKIDPAFVGTLGNSAARITVQQQVNRQLSVTYATNVNYTAQQLLQAQYDLTPNASIVVTRDESGVYSVVYKIRRRYK